ncbi:MAG: TIGR00725 family protein [Goleter apudmare HA4340-LM2]|jgi:hypothetical protein|nr:TIGR00725 family protein [Goleter apudmare HA4340-LM2]
MRKTVIGVMGPGDQATEKEIQNAYKLGELIAQQGWVLLTGGRNVGVMDAASQGAKSANGLTIGVLPRDNENGISAAVDIAIFTDMGNARNNINVISSDVVIACGMGIGTASEVALALKANQPVILLSDDEISKVFFKKMSPANVYIINSCEQAIATIKLTLNNIKRYSISD